MIMEVGHLFTYPILWKGLVAVFKELASVQFFMVKDVNEWGRMLIVGFLCNF